MAGLRTPTKQFSSCVLIESDDSLDSIKATTNAIVSYVSKKAGIGIGGSALRSLNDKVGVGDVIHTGVTPFYRLWQSAVESCSQGGIRRGSATLNVLFWHPEIMNILSLKNSKGTEENRARNLDYCVLLNKTMYERLLQKKNITLFSPKDVPEVYQAYFGDPEKFKELYEKAERTTKIPRKTISAEELFGKLVQERAETGRIYILNIDHANKQTPLNEPIKMTNLCLSGDSLVEISIEGEEKTITLKELDTLFKNNKEILVLSENLEKNQKEFKRVLDSGITHPSAETLIINHQTGSLQLTHDHKVFVENKGFIRAIELNPGDVFRTKNGPSKISFLKEVYDGIPVYDITVEDNHNFYANDMLVHNCVEILQHTDPVSLDQDKGLIALCTLSALNMAGKKIEKNAELVVKALDALLDYQDYMEPAAERHTMLYRPLGIGVTNLAYFLAKNRSGYTDPNLELVDEWFETMTFYCIKASMELAKRFGPCIETKYHDGLFPKDLAKEKAKGLVKRGLNLDWEGLSEDCKKYGVRNSTLFAIMPSETSSLISNSTNGIDQVRSLITFKSSNDGPLPQVVPDIEKLGKHYELLWDSKSMRGMIDIAATIQKWFDQSISLNLSYVPSNYPDNNIPLSLLLNDILYAYQMGIKTLYYHNTRDGSGEVEIKEENCESCSI
jgi:ribonucleotide reductase alpha subunit